MAGEESTGPPASNSHSLTPAVALALGGSGLVVSVYGVEGWVASLPVSSSGLVASVLDAEG